MGPRNPKKGLDYVGKLLYQWRGHLQILYQWGQGPTIYKQKIIFHLMRYRLNGSNDAFCPIIVQVYVPYDYMYIYYP